jgi:hypothetical protein
MRNGLTSECSTADLRGGSKAEVKSLFQKTLAVSLCDSGFWQDQALSPSHKLLEIKTLEKSAGKN